MSQRVVIRGVESALASREVTNEEFAAAHPGWKIGEVAKRTGVLSRRFAARGETALDLGERAARSLLQRLSVPATAVDGILFCTQTPDHPMPPNATLLQHRLGLSTRVMATDYSLACSGYVYGLFIAKALIASGSLENVLLVTGDTYSHLMGPEDRGTMTLFGDGAAATLLSSGDRGGLGRFELGTDGGRASCFWVPAGGARTPSSEETRRPVTDRSGNIRSAEQIQMDGAAVLDFVRRDVPSTVRTLLEKSSLTVADLDLVVLHQASQLSLDMVQRALAIPTAKMFSSIAHSGNTVSASIPMALRSAETAGRLASGMRVLLVGFGVGLSWGACIVEW